MLIICMLCALLAITIGTQGAHSVFAVSKSEVHYSGRTDTSSVAVMINVYWGEEYLPEMLQTLENYGAKATFFIGGCWADDNNSLLMEIAALSVYMLNVWYVAVFLKADVAICWTCEHSYNIVIMLLTYFYLRRNNWCCKIV